MIETTLTAKELNFIKYDSVPKGEMEITGAIRYNDDGAIGILKQLGNDEIQVHFPTGREAITPGQAIVCYEGDDVVAGGWIKKVNVSMQQEMDSSFNLKNFHTHSTIMIRTFILMTLFISTILGTATQAQFNGVLDIQLYIKNDVGITDTSLIHMYVTPERILMQGAEEESIKVGTTKQVVY